MSQNTFANEKNLLNAALCGEQRGEFGGGCASAWVGVTQRAMEAAKRLAGQRLRLVKLPLGLQQESHVADGGQRVGVRVAQRAPTPLKVLAAQRLRLAKLPLDLKQGRQVADGDQRVSSPPPLLPRDAKSGLVTPGGNAAVLPIYKKLSTRSCRTTPARRRRGVLYSHVGLLESRSHGRAATLRGLPARLNRVAAGCAKGGLKTLFQVRK